jgi:hypothetical protein
MHQLIASVLIVAPTPLTPVQLRIINPDEPPCNVCLIKAAGH